MSLSDKQPYMSIFHRKLTHDRILMGGRSVEVLQDEACLGIVLGSLKKFQVRGGENVEKMKLTIKLIQVLTEFVRAINETIRLLRNQ